MFQKLILKQCGSLLLAGLGFRAPIVRGHVWGNFDMDCEPSPRFGFEGCRPAEVDYLVDLLETTAYKERRDAIDFQGQDLRILVFGVTAFGINP